MGMPVEHASHRRTSRHSNGDTKKRGSCPHLALPDVQCSLFLRLRHTPRLSPAHLPQAGIERLHLCVPLPQRALQLRHLHQYKHQGNMEQGTWKA